MMIERSQNFTEYEFPLDYLWSDIEWADQYDGLMDGGYQYFDFNPFNFTDASLARLNKHVEDVGRYITVIADPHIKASNLYRVYRKGMEMQDDILPTKHVPTENLVNIFARTCNGTVFYGSCWPGNSSWIDVLNENAQEYWASQFSYKNFIGSTYRYSIWNDMNEPSVFNSIKTMDSDALHYKADGRVFEHRDIHNAYGALHQRSSWRGLLKRD